MVTLQTFYLGKLDLLPVYLGKCDFLSVTDFSLSNLPRGNLSSESWICLENNRVFLDSKSPKRWLGKNEIPRLLTNRRSSAKVLMTEPDIAHAVKEILGTRGVYVFAFLHLVIWISISNNSEIKEKIISLISWKSLCAPPGLPYQAESLCILPSWIYASKNLTGVKTLKADIGSVISQEFFT